MEDASMTINIEKIQMSIYETKDRGAVMLPISFEEWEERARQTLASGPFDYVYGAAGAGDTLRANLEAFKKYRIRPRVCTDISKHAEAIDLFRTSLSAPILLAPIGVNSILHPDAELAPARAAAALGVPYIFK
jgi:lactate 2-monooxygenase